MIMSLNSIGTIGLYWRPLRLVVTQLVLQIRGFSECAGLDRTIEPNQRFEQ